MLRIVEQRPEEKAGELPAIGVQQLLDFKPRRSEIRMGLRRA